MSQLEYIEATRGRTCRFSIALFEDAAHSKVLTLTNMTVRLTFGADWLVLTSGNGLTVNAAAGTVEVKLTPIQTSEAPAPQLNFVLDIEESATEVLPPLKGTISFAPA